MIEMLTESEFWTAVADYIEATGEMPPHRSGNLMSGLCAVVEFSDGVINYETRRAARTRIQRALRRGCSFLARAGEAKPRIEWARKFAAEAWAEEMMSS